MRLSRFAALSRSRLTALLRGLGDRRDGVALVSSACLGVLYYAYIYGLRTVWPANIDWVLRDDRGTHFLGWLFFKNEPWHWPLGHIEGIAPPVGSSVAFTDSIPWLAVLAKLLGGGSDTPFQYTGIYLLACFALLGVFGVLLARRFTKSVAIQLLCAAFFVTAAMVTRRVYHVALAGHFILLAGIWLYALGTQNLPPRRYLALWALLTGIVAGIHPYLTAMFLVLCFAAHVRESIIERSIQVWLAAVHVALCTFVAVSVFWAFGLFTNSSATVGFGEWSADLLTFVNPMGYGRLLPSLPTRFRQIEGFAYLGAGALGLAVLAVIAIASGRIRVEWRMVRCHLPLIVLAILMFCYALATPVFALRRPLVDLGWLYEPFAMLTGTFRASGRFVWVLFYLVLWAILAAVARSFPKRYVVGLLSVALVVQLIDLQPLLSRHAQRAEHLGWHERLRSPLWRHLGDEHDVIVPIPPLLLPSTTCFPFRQRHQRLLVLGFVAARQGMDYFGSLGARAPEETLYEMCTQIRSGLEQGRVNERAVYAVDARYLDVFQWWTRGKLPCRKVDGFNLCLGSEFDPLRQRPALTLPLDLQRKGHHRTLARFLRGFGRATKRGRQVSMRDAQIELPRAITGDVEVTLIPSSGEKVSWSHFKMKAGSRVSSVEAIAGGRGLAVFADHPGFDRITLASEHPVWLRRVEIHVPAEKIAEEASTSDGTATSFDAKSGD